MTFKGIERCPNRVPARFFTIGGGSSEPVKKPHLKGMHLLPGSVAGAGAGLAAHHPVRASQGARQGELQQLPRARRLRQQQRVAGRAPGQRADAALRTQEEGALCRRHI